MRHWQVRWRLALLGALCITAGFAIPFVPSNTARDDLLASGLVIGGIAMLLVAVDSRNGDH